MPDSAEPQAADDRQRLTWRSHPLVDYFPRSLVFVGMLIGACALVGIAFEGIGYGLLAAVVLAGATAKYILPTTFELDDEGVTVRFFGRSQKRRWTEFRRTAHGPSGMLLSPFASPSRLDSFRGVQIRFTNNADEVVSFVEHKMASATMEEAD
ncbi:MAG: hypothetical protein ACYS8X_07005 [Planctomycetota bacterium]|jgi:hypothetical protein